MKRFLVFAAVVVASLFIAVESSAQMVVGAGYSLNVQHEGIGTDKNMRKGSEITLLNGFYVSLGYDWRFVESSVGDFSVNPMLKYSYYTDGEDFDRMFWVQELPTDRVSYKEHYLSLPIDLKYGYEFGASGVKLFVTTGPVLALGLYAGLQLDDRSTYVGDINMYNGKYSLRTSTGDRLEDSIGKTGYSRFDCRWGVGVGVEIDEDFIIKAGYDFGLLDRYKNRETTHTLCMDEFHLGVAYLF